jgi:hypothetical protein
MILIYSAPDAGPEPGTPEAEQNMQEWFAYTKELEDAGVLLGGDALQSVDSAVTVRTRDGVTTHTDGPFAETKEVLGGYYMIDVETTEEALTWAEKIPSTPYGSTEVRPLLELG